MMKSFYFLVISAIPVAATAQNLIPNPGFEIYSECPQQHGQLERADGWFSPTGASPDFLNACSTGNEGEVSVPVNFFGYQQARTGNGYASSIYRSQTENYREYLSIGLNQPLISGECYLMEFYVNLGGYSDYRPDKIAVLFSDTALNYFIISNISDITPQLLVDAANPLDTANWVKASGEYEAAGGEQFVTIGNFQTDEGLNLFPLYGNTNVDAIIHVLIDDVSLTPCFVTGQQTLFSCGPYTTEEGIVYNESTIFTTVLTAANGWDSLVTNALTVYPLPDVDAGSDIITIILGDTVQLNASGALSYVWSPTEGLSCSNCASPLASPQETTIYTVTGTDSLGCTKTDSVRVEVDIICKEAFIPTIFSPNGKGPQANETFCVFSDCVEQFKLVIHNRWGERIFESEDIGSCWDGTYKGAEVPTGVYAFNMYLRQIDGKVLNKTGLISLYR
jgi:gliding motility-associated-like protein